MEEPKRSSKTSRRTTCSRFASTAEDRMPCSRHSSAVTACGGPENTRNTHSTPCPTPSRPRHSRPRPGPIRSRSRWRRTSAPATSRARFSSMPRGREGRAFLQRRRACSPGSTPRCAHSRWWMSRSTSAPCARTATHCRPATPRSRSAARCAASSRRNAPR